MTDDIVDRLREYVATEGSIEWHLIMLDAADEIERLRKELDLWQKSAVELASQLGKEQYAHIEYAVQRIRSKKQEEASHGIH